MKFHNFAIAAVFASLLGTTAAVHAQDPVITTDRQYLAPYTSTTYTDLFMNGGESGTASVKGFGNSVLRLSLYDASGDLVNNTTCRYNNCTLSWKANWSGNFYLKVENLSPYTTVYGIALGRY